VLPNCWPAELARSPSHSGSKFYYLQLASRSSVQSSLYNRYQQCKPLWGPVSQSPRTGYSSLRRDTLEKNNNRGTPLDLVLITLPFTSPHQLHQLLEHTRLQRLHRMPQQRRPLLPLLPFARRHHRHARQRLTAPGRRATPQLLRHCLHAPTLGLASRPPLHHRRRREAPSRIGDLPGLP
jgi:hypothetical protein